ncbi:MAG: ATP synthase F1 subunit delta [Myxococcota bacterium]|nr:ATP synthase F1 subunit delta [Myxococcota bacterium]
MSAAGKRYARAAVEAAMGNGGIEAVQKLSEGLGRFRDAYVQSSELREVLSNPALKDVRESVLRAILTKLDTSTETVNLVLILAENDRVGALDDVAQDIHAIADEKAGRLRALVKSAIALDGAHETRIAKALEKRLGQPVTVATELDPSLLGGLVCQVGDLTFDSSIKRQLEIVRDKLQSGRN